MICLEHIKKSFSNNEVLKDINLKVNDGEVIAAVSYTHLFKMLQMLQ